MAFHGDGVAPALGASHDMERQRQQRKEDKNSRPGNFARADPKQHYDREADDSGIQPRSPKGTRRRRWHRAQRFGTATIEPAIEPLENRHGHRRDEIPSEIVADRYAEMRPRRVVPENPAEKPTLAEHA